MASVIKYSLKCLILLAVLNISRLFIWIPTLSDSFNFLKQIPHLKRNEKKTTINHHGTAINYTKEFIYLVQCEGCLSTYYASDDVLGLGDRHDILALSYKRKCTQTYPAHVRYITAPYQTTWTSGRNILYRFASLNQSSVYNYYIFIDEDLILEDNNAIYDIFHKELNEEGLRMLQQKISPWRKFENFLMYYQPAIGIAEGIVNMKLLLQKREKNIPAYVFPGMVIDAMFNAFHYDVITDLLPYDERFDKISWWGSQEIMQCRIFFRYHAHAVTFMSVIVNNTLHHQYPQRILPLKQVCWKEIPLLPRSMKNSHLTHTWMKKKSYHSLNHFTYVAPPNLPIKKYKYSVRDYCSNNCALRRQWRL